MKAVIIHATGDADVLRLEEVERPEPGEDEVLIREQAAAVNPVDWKYRRGLVQRELPAVLGGHDAVLPCPDDEGGPVEAR